MAHQSEPFCLAQAVQADGFDTSTNSHELINVREAVVITVAIATAFPERCKVTAGQSTQ
jgi:hypothetical protein